MDVVRFMGGLGNQMFQYAFLKSLEKRNRNVIASLGFYTNHPDLMNYELDKVFKNIKLVTEVDTEFMLAYNRWCENKNEYNRLVSLEGQYADCFFWKESPEQYGSYQRGVYDTTECVFAGYWQTYKYFQNIRKKLLKDFEFDRGEEKLCNLKRVIESSDRYVSVHVRRGDYLQLPELYGNICVDGYYKEAIAYISRIVENPIFVFFSDDIEWVKRNMFIERAIYVESSIFEQYQSWYDMALMSVCSHNIIANSSFSWWGAWLNQRIDRVVIAPKVWNGKFPFPDICPVDWVRL